MLFDIRTLLVVAAVVSALCAVARFLLWRTHRRLPGLLRWAWASAAGALALLLIAGHDGLPPLIALSLPQVLILGGFLLAWDGFRRFLDRPPLSRRLVGTLGVVGVAVVATAHVGQSIPLRTAFNAVMLSGFSAAIARDLLRHAPPDSLAMRVTALTYAVNAVFFGGRLVTLLHTPLPAVPLLSDGLAAWGLLWFLAFTLGTTLGMVLMAGERVQADLDDLASRDPLTGTFNRRAFTLLAEREVARARRHGQALTALMMDFDHFKRINDDMGHASGDHVLRRFVDGAREVLRGEDVLGRYGGEEFVALLPQTGAAAALAAAERLRRAFAAAAASDQDPLAPTWPLTVSIGIAQWLPGEPLEDLLRRADGALYAAKNAGRDRCWVGEPPTIAA